jgi:hypothetical protein
MAGPFTHMAVTDQAKTNFPATTKFGKLLRQNLKFLVLGSVSPDIPYLSQLTYLNPIGGHVSSSWADIMHYHQTNGIVLNGLHSFRAAKNKGEEWDAELAWLCGFVSHLVVDATIHPIVESIVGPYTDPKVHGNHTQSEMTQDVMIFHDVRNQDLTEARYADILQTVLGDDNFTAVADFWSNHAHVNCPYAGYLDVKNALNSYEKELGMAQGGNPLAAAFRHFGSKFVYKTYDDLMHEPDLVKRYYSGVRLPDGSTGPFLKRGFEFAVSNLTAVWSKINRALFTNDNITEIIPNWNLDTGVDQASGIQTYWG